MNYRHSLRQFGVAVESILSARMQEDARDPFGLNNQTVQPTLGRRERFDVQPLHIRISK
jgi:hypothetical protein